MRCDNCGNDEAVIQLTKVKENEMKVLHLCQACASEEGVESVASGGSIPLTDFLAQIGKGVGDEAATLGPCPECGLTPAQLKQTGRLGCAACYTHYEPHLRGLLRRLHGGTQHAGKIVTAPSRQDLTRQVQVENLRRSLRRAVEAEDFEHAALLRDQIHQLEAQE